MLKMFCVPLFAFALSAPLLSQANPQSPLQMMVNGEADAALVALQSSIKANPSSSEEHNLACRVHYAEEHWDAAVTECERAASLNPTSSTNQLWLARAYGEKAEHASWLSAIGLAKKSRAAFEKAVELDANNVDARSDLSEYYVEAPGFLGGGTEKAAAQADIIEKLEPATAYWVRARIAEKDKNNQQAEQAYRKAIELGHNPARRWFDLASFYRRANRLDDLETAIKTSARVNANNDSTLVDGASLLLRVNRNLPLAESMLRRYIEQGSRTEDAPVFKAQFLLGQVLERSGKESAARQAYEVAHANAAAFLPAASALKRLGA